MDGNSCWRRAMSVAVAAIFVCGLAGGARAETQWEASHPRRDQVNDRLQTQDRRIDRERREGEISATQARRLHREDHAIRREERAMAAPDDGHIGKGEQQLLDRQENRVSRQIGE